MGNLCRWLVMPSSELEKVLPEYREEVKLDAEKCIKEECPAFFQGKCNKIQGGIQLLNINGNGIGSYYPEECKLI